jgi:hypothetical protein
MRRFTGLSCVFILCFFLDLYIPQSHLAMPFVGFSPFLCTLMGRSRFKTLLVMALISGIIHDLFTLQHRVGISSVAYLFAILLNAIYRRKYYEENLIPFFSVTFSLSLGYSLFFLLFGAFKGLVIAINFKMLLYQLLFYPLFDAGISLVGVFIPVKVYTLLKKIILKTKYAS